MLHTFQPKSAKLKKYIDLFYVYADDKPQRFSYIVFPHVNTGISFFKGVELSRHEFQININQSQSKTTCCAEITGKYTNPLIINYEGNFEEIAVIFKPLGVNQFFDENVNELAPSYSQALTNKKWIDFSYALFAKIGIEERLALLETFLLDNLVEKDHTIVAKAITCLEDMEADYRVEDVADMLGISAKTLQRKFINAMACRPAEYKRIARFRNALKTKLVADEVTSFTRILYEHNYYDQSYFIKEFKKLTRLNPKKFFEAVSVLNEEKIIWEIK